eukprot:CAMPEP_0169460388 /NCGR_PEP_ID=MMETSP1042-20121227/18458_1 /TAXON_ID=464988 /ORGANISM="Hemiselmis andersenii, Strain CCMP1180" /LENGTH=160 /DNA_ID=CAMNT_0009572871 /DNA_START=147 /DNA_END=630 /DNA_ORIENTATION=+
MPRHPTLSAQIKQFPNVGLDVHPVRAREVFCTIPPPPDALGSVPVHLSERFVPLGAIPIPLQRAQPRQHPPGRGMRFREARAAARHVLLQPLAHVHGLAHVDVAALELENNTLAAPPFFLLGAHSGSPVLVSLGTLGNLLRVGSRHNGFLCVACYFGVGL